MDREAQRAAAKKALRSIRRDAGRAALGSHVPEDKRPSAEFLLSIGIGHKDPKPDEDEDEDEDTTAGEG